MWIALFIVILGASVMLHEAGHFAIAKLFGMRCTQFFVGFGPTIWSFTRGETEYGFKAIPAGGYVRIVGMNPTDDTITDEDRATGRLFYQQSSIKRLLVLLGGVTMNIVFAACLMLVAFTAIGHEVQTHEVRAILPGGAAQLGGIVAGDTITAVNDTPIPDFASLVQAVHPLAGKAATIAIERDGAPQHIEVTIGTSEQGLGQLGVYPTVVPKHYALGEAWQEVLQGPASIPNQVVLTAKGLVSVFSPSGIGGLFTQLAPGAPRSETSATSVIGLGQIVNALGTDGRVFSILMLLAQLNVMLAVLNVLPFPPFDGGHVAVLAIENVVNARRRAKGNKEPYHVSIDQLVPVALVVIGAFGIITVLAVIGDLLNPASNLVK